MEFQVGDHVVFPSQGGGVVDEVTTRDVLGERHEYLKIRFVRGNMEMLVPLGKNTDVGLRRAIEESELEGIELAMREADLRLPNAWPPRHRAELDLIAEANAYRLARLVGTLTIRDREKGLASTEREIMEQAKALLASEIAVATSVTFEAAQERIAGVLVDLHP